jgi:Subtilase family
MASRKGSTRVSAAADDTSRTSSSVDEMLLAAIDRGDDTLQTGRFIATHTEGAAAEGKKSLVASRGMTIADARDFTGQQVTAQDVAGSDGIHFPEIGVTLLGGAAAQERGMLSAAALDSDPTIASIDPEHFVFADGPSDLFFQQFAAGVSNPGDYLRGFVRAAETIAKDLGEMGLGGTAAAALIEEQAVALATWGLTACKVPPSTRTGAGIKLAILDTGMDLGHPDFVGRAFTTATFVGQPVQDLNGHGTHTCGTTSGPKTPTSPVQRYGIAFKDLIFIGKVLSNSGGGTDATVLAGMNWAIANRCEVISMSLGGPSGPQPFYTVAGQRALDSGLLIIAAAGNSGGPTGAPANSPTIMSVAALNENLTVPSFSSFGKVEIAGPGVNVFSSVPRPVKYGIKSGTSMACPHVAGCAALWAETSPTLRGLALWNKLRATARPLPFPPTRVGSGLVQAPA